MKPRCGIITWFLVAGCSQPRGSSIPSQLDVTGTKENVPVMVLGDIQVKSAFETLLIPTSDNKATITVEQWKGLTIDYSILENLELRRIIAETKPAQILQAGDMVESDNAYALHLKNASGTTEKFPAPYDEWDVLKQVSDPNQVYSAIGNHEIYKTVGFKGSLDADQRLATLDLNDMDFDSHSALERHNLLLERYPQLKSNTLFHEKTGTYFREFDQYCLVSFDGTAVEAGQRDALFTFFRKTLSRCNDKEKKKALKPIIVMNHYPLFSANKDEQHLPFEALPALVRLFNELNVTLVISGHEHVYMRYAPSYLADVGFESVPTPHAVYVTVGSFGNTRTIDPMAARFSGEPGKNYVYSDKNVYATLVFNEQSALFTAFAFAAGRWQQIDQLDIPW